MEHTTFSYEDAETIRTHHVVLVHDALIAVYRENAERTHTIRVIGKFIRLLLQLLMDVLLRFLLLRFLQVQLEKLGVEEFPQKG